MDWASWKSTGSKWTNHKENVGAVRSGYEGSPKMQGYIGGSYSQRSMKTNELHAAVNRVLQV